MLTGLAIATKIAIYISALVSVGLASHYAFGITRSQKGIRLAIILFLMACAGRLLVSNAQLSGSLSGAFSGEMLPWVWQSLGNQIIAFVIGATAMLFASLKPQKLFFIIGVALIALGFGLSGHVQGLENPGLFPLLVALHVFIVGFWVAAPISLAPNRYGDDHALYIATSRFSYFAIWLIPFVFLSGMVLLWVLAGGIGGITRSNYGWLVIAKLLLTILLLAIGAYNKTKVSVLLRDDPAGGRAKLALTLKLEAFLFIIIITLITLATTITGPP